MLCFLSTEASWNAFKSLQKPRHFIRHLTCLQNEELRFVLSLCGLLEAPLDSCKTGVHIHILKKCGLPFFFNRNKKRSFFGDSFLPAASFLCSTRIWNIHIEGNIAYSTPEILGFLKEEDVVHGMAKREVHCQSLAAKVREQFPKITWVSARIEGTQLILTVQEGKGLTRKKNRNFALQSVRQPGRYDCKDHHQKRRSPGEAGRCVQA